MIYQSTSIDEVIARIVRNTRLQDPSYLVDSEEWIPEAMGYMKTKFVLAPRWQDVDIHYHRAKMPCGLVSLRAVQYQNCRLPYYNGSRSADSFNNRNSQAASVYPGIPMEGTTTFGTQIVKRGTEDDGIPVYRYETELEKVNCLSFHVEHWYYTEMGYINTSMSEACIRLHYHGIPLDPKGLPLIPDEENYKEALYWYVRAKMIGTGYEDKIFTYDSCMARFDTHAQRARSRITYPSVDQQEAKMQNLTRLIMPENYWSSFDNPGSGNNYVAFADIPLI